MGGDCTKAAEVGVGAGRLGQDQAIRGVFGGTTGCRIIMELVDLPMIDLALICADVLRCVHRAWKTCRYVRE